MQHGIGRQHCYFVAIGRLDENCTFEKEYKYFGNPLEQTSTCSCGMFSRTRILCNHTWKGLDLMNIKSLPAHYVLKWWTHGACSGIVLDSHGRNIIENPILNAMFWYKDMTNKFLKLVLRAASRQWSTLLVNNTLDIIASKLKKKSMHVLILRFRSLLPQMLLLKVIWWVQND